MSTPTPEQLAETYIRSKKANVFGIQNPDEVISHMAPYSLGGAGLGALLGVLREYLSSDEKATGLNRDALETVLTGALLGGGAGTGLGYFTSPMKTSAEGDAPAPDPDVELVGAGAPPSPIAELNSAANLILPVDDKGEVMEMLRPEDVNGAAAPNTSGKTLYQDIAGNIRAGRPRLDEDGNIVQPSTEQKINGLRAAKELHAVLMPGEDRRAIAEAVNDPNGQAAGRYRVDYVGGIPVTVVNLGGREVRLPYTDPTNEADYPVPTQFDQNAPLDTTIRMNPAYAARVVAREYGKANGLIDNPDPKDDLSDEDFDRFASQFNIEEMYRSNPDALQAALGNDELAPMLIRSFQMGGSSIGLTGQQDTPYRYSIPQVQPGGTIRSIDLMSKEAPNYGLIGATTAGGAYLGARTLPNMSLFDARPPTAETNRVLTATEISDRLSRENLSRANLPEIVEDLNSPYVRQSGKAPRLLSRVIQADIDGSEELKQLYRQLEGDAGRFPGKADRMKVYAARAKAIGDSITLPQAAPGAASRIRSPKGRLFSGALGALPGLGLGLYLGTDKDPISAQDAMDRALSKSRPSFGGLFTGPDSPFGAPSTGRFSGNIMDIYGTSQPQQR